MIKNSQGQLEIVRDSKIVIDCQIQQKKNGHEQPEEAIDEQMDSNVVRYIQRLSDIFRDGQRQSDSQRQSEIIGEKQKKLGKEDNVRDSQGQQGINRFGPVIRYSRTFSKIVTNKNILR